MSSTKPRIFFTRLSTEGTQPALDPLVENILQEDFELITSRMVEEKPELWDTIQGSVTYTAWEPEQRRLLEKARNLKVVCSLGVGTNHLDLDYWKSRGIPVGYTPTAVTDATADMAFALILTTICRIKKAITDFENPPHEIRPIDVHGATLGIVGMGRIGTQVARRSIGFDMKILYHNRSRRESEEQQLNAVYYGNLREMLPRCDIVVVTCPLSPGTRGLFGDEEFACMKPGAYIINVGRGPVIQTDALVRALREKRLGGAGLDVTDPEPLPRDHPLFHMDNVIITPHCAVLTRPTLRRVFQQTVENLKAVIFDGQRPIQEVPQE